MSSRSRSRYGGRRTDLAIQQAQTGRPFGGTRLQPIPPAPVIPPVQVAPACVVCDDTGCEFCPKVEQWPAGYHAADSLHPFDYTPADLDLED